MSDPRDTQQSRPRCTCSSTDMRQCENDAVYRGRGRFGFLLACEGHVPYLLVQIGQVEKLAAQPSDSPALPYEKCGQLLRTVGDKTLTCSRRKRHGGFCNNYMDSPESVAPRPPAPSEPLRCAVALIEAKAAAYEKGVAQDRDEDEHESAVIGEGVAEMLRGLANEVASISKSAPRVEAPAPRSITFSDPYAVTGITQDGDKGEVGRVAGVECANPPEAPAPLPQSSWIVMCPHCKATWVEAKVSDDFLRMHIAPCPGLKGVEPSAAPSPTLPPPVNYFPTDKINVEPLWAYLRTNKQEVAAMDSWQRGETKPPLPDLSVIMRSREQGEDEPYPEESPSPTAAEGERPRDKKKAACPQCDHEEHPGICVVMCLGDTEPQECGCRFTTDAPEQADRGAVQTAMPPPKSVAELAAKWVFSADGDHRRMLDGHQLAAFGEEVRAETLKFAPTPLSAEELAPLLVESNLYGGGTPLELAKKLVALPGVAVVRKS